MQHSVDYLREALQLWLVAGEKINYSEQDNDILTTIGFSLTQLHGIVENSHLHKTRIT
ncbi:phage polarity suppression protein [Klebsiella variicola]|nr:phage polarity suppression protein [Klebsiella variicola]